MKKEYLEEILDDLDIKYKNSSKNYLTIACPFAAISRLHKHDVDRNMSGYVSYSETEGSYFGCFNCEHHGGSYKTINKLSELYRSDKYRIALNKVRQYEIKYDNYIVEAESLNDNFFDRIRDRVLTATHPIVNLPSVMYDLDTIDNYDNDYDLKLQSYFISRGYSTEDAENVIEKFGLLVSKKSRRGIFIVKDFLNHIVGSMEIVTSGSDTAPKYIAHFKSANFLLNEQIFFNREYNSMDIVVAEGLLDMMRLSLRHKLVNIVGLQGKIKEYQMNKILYFSKTVYFFSDMDNVGVENVKKLGEYYEKNKHLFGYVKILAFNDFQKGDDPDSFFKGKDINEYDIRKGLVYWTKFVEDNTPKQVRNDI